MIESVKFLNKRKIINDPVHGFVNIPTDFIYDLIEHRYFQRLRRIKQLGLTNYVYPGATHTRFQHTIGALHLMSEALDSLKNKNIEFTPEEEEGVQIAILLHDIGHGPFSHALEETLIAGIHHEEISQILMEDLNLEFNGKLTLAIDIFNNRYPKKFLHQLVSSQLDMDRLDYIKRDSFFTGVTEGTIGTDRIIKMLNVSNDQLVVEKKGIYSIEKFLIARRLMYWQVYFHKTVIAAEYLLVKMLNRAKYIAQSRSNLFTTPSLSYFLYQKIDREILIANTREVIQWFVNMDDNDIMVVAKEWMNDTDKVLSMLAGNLINRKLPAVIINDQKFSEIDIKTITQKIMINYNLSDIEAGYLLFTGEISNNAFSSKDDMIKILMSTDEIKDIAEVSDILNIPYLQKSEKKHFICFPKDCR